MWKANKEFGIIFAKNETQDKLYVLNIYYVLNICQVWLRTYHKITEFESLEGTSEVS